MRFQSVSSVQIHPGSSSRPHSRLNTTTRCSANTSSANPQREFPQATPNGLSAAAASSSATTTTSPTTTTSNTTIHTRNIPSSIDSLVTNTPSPSPSPSPLIVTTFRWPSQLPGRSVSVTGSFNNWSSPLPLTRVPGGDWVRSIALPEGPIQFKFVVDGEYMCSPAELAANEHAGGAVNNQRLIVPSCEFIWPSGALGGSAEVMVAGDWSGWGELLPLTFDPVTNTHSLRCCLPAGTYAYQFLVDGEWRLRPDADAVHTPDGHFANVLSVALPPTFRIFYSTGWSDASLMVRGLDGDGKPIGDGSFRRVPLLDTASRGHWRMAGRRWKTAKVAASGPDAPAALEFYPVGGSKPQGMAASSLSTSLSEDRPPGGGVYHAPRPGGYKLSSGKVRPFLRASRPRIMLTADLDGTLVGDGPDADAKTSDFGSYWEDNAALVGSVLVYNTGRSLGQFQGLLESKGGALPVPDVLITAVGTKIFLLDREGGTRGTATGLSWSEDLQWAKILDEGWELGAVREAGNQAIMAAPGGAAHWLDDASEHPHRIALSVRADAVGVVKHKVEGYLWANQVRAQIIVSGTGDWRYVDVVSAQGGKLAALEYVRALFGIARERCVAAGDSGNDALMLGGGNPAVVVGNAQDELLEWVMKQPQDGRLVVADAVMAHGVLEGMARLGLY